jgi:hypothetical protein
MPPYDFFIAGRWRNQHAVRKVLAAVRASGHSAYCFIENSYSGEKITFTSQANPDVFMKQSEALQPDDPLIRKIFATDMAAQRAANAFLLVFPAGLAAHIEAGVAYGLGKPCYAVGAPEKTETLYAIFDRIFPDLPALQRWLEKQPST